MSILNKEKILEQARIFVEEGRYDKAIKEYEKILSADPSDMRVKLRIAELYVKRKQIAEAIRVYREVAVAYSGEGFYLKAVTVYKNILRLNPSLIEVNDNLADLYVKMGLVGDAVRQYEIYAAALDQKGEFEMLLEIRKKIVELKPDDGSARVKLAEMYQREGKNEDALDQYEEYARRLETSGKDQSRLIEVYEKILTHRGGHEEMLRSLVKIYYEKGDIKKALKWLEFAKTLTPVDVELLGMQAEIYAKLNQLETARSKYLTLADLYREKENIDDAVMALAQIALLIPSEEERVEKRAAEISPDAAAKFKSALIQLQQKEEQRKEREEKIRAGEEVEETRPDEDKTIIAPQPKEPPAKREPEGAEEKAATTKPSEKKTAAAEKAKEEERKATKAKTADETLIIPVEELLKPKKAEQAPEKKAEKKEVQPTKGDDKKHQAEAAYKLAVLYKKIGLEDESKSELVKAETLYNELAPTSSKAASRLNEIRSMLGIKKPAPKPTEKKQSAPPKPTTTTHHKEKKEHAATVKTKTAPKREHKKPSPEKDKPKKRKVSFV